MQVTAKMFYRELRTALGPLMKESGFKTVAGGRLGWTRQTAAGHLTVSFQCDKWGWDENWGSKFTLEFVVAPGPGSEMPLRGGRSERIGYLLEGFEELDDLRMRNNKVIEHLPGTVNGRLVTTRLDDGTEYVAAGERVDTMKAIYGRDLWLNYYSAEDARAWASYFAKNLLRFISMFENEVRSEEGKARVRFNVMMSNVQGTKAVLEKERLFENYIENETDEEFRTAAVRWLRYLKEMVGAREARQNAQADGPDSVGSAD